MLNSKKWHKDYIVKSEWGTREHAINSQIPERETLAALSRLLSPETTASIVLNIWRLPNRCHVIAVLPAAKGQAYCTARGRTFSNWNQGASYYIEQVLQVGLCFVYYRRQWWAPAPLAL
jgi:hypothetical protein